MLDKIAVSQISGIPETMLIPLWARAEETARPDALVRDEKAVEMVSRIDYDFSRFKNAWRSQAGCALRAMLFDSAVRDFLRRKPQAVVVNLGAGLDTRSTRLEREKFSCWYDLDLPQAMELRKQFLKETPRNIFLSQSVFDLSWTEDVAHEGRPVLFIAEGLLMYFTEEEIRPLFVGRADRFPNSEMLAEMLAPFLVGRNKYHDSVNKTGSNAEFKWGPKDSRALERWDPRIRFIEDWNYFDYCPERWGWMRWCGKLPWFRVNFNSRIAHLKFGCI